MKIKRNVTNQWPPNAPPRATPLVLLPGSYIYTHIHTPTYIRVRVWERVHTRKCVFPSHSTGFTTCLTHRHTYLYTHIHTHVYKSACVRVGALRAPIRAILLVWPPVSHMYTHVYTHTCKYACVGARLECSSSSHSVGFNICHIYTCIYVSVHAWERQEYMYTRQCIYMQQYMYDTHVW